MDVSERVWRYMAFGILAVFVAGNAWRLSSITLESLIFVGGALLVFIVFTQRWGPMLLGLMMMIIPLPIAIAKYPVSHKFMCHRIPAQPKLANCHFKLKHLSRWGDYQRDYPEIAKAKILPVNAISSAEPGGKRKRDQPITVQYHPVFLMNRLNRSQKLKDFDYRQASSKQVVERINQFLANGQSTFTIDLFDEPQVSRSGMTQRDYVLFSLFQVVILGMAGLAIVLKNIAIYLNSLLPESERNPRLMN